MLEKYYIGLLKLIYKNQMKTNILGFAEDNVLHKLAHYLPAQNPLKDFVHHNTLHAFQDKPFFEALQEASELFGYKTFLALHDFRKLYTEGTINKRSPKSYYN